MQEHRAAGAPVTRAVLLALLAVLLWSGNFIVARAYYKSVPPVTLAFFRWTVATIVLLPIAWSAVKRDLPLLKKHGLYLCLVAVTGVTLFNTLIYVAGHTTSATNLALIGTTASPIFVLVITSLFMRHATRVTQYIGAVICIAGILVLLSGGSMQKLVNFHFTSGDLWILAAALSFAIYTVLVRRRPAAISSTSFLFAAFFLGTLFLLPAYLVERAHTPMQAPDVKLVSVFLYLGIGASVISFLCWNYAVKVIGPARTSLFGNLIPALSAVEAVIILSEPFPITTLIAIALIAAGIFIGNISLLRR